MNTKPGWSPNFFSGLILESVKLMYSEEQTREECEFLLAALALPAGARVADVPCGNGRLSLPLAAKGLQITGVDCAAELLDDARRAAADKQLPATFEQHEMRELPWTAMFDGAFCLGNSFAYFDDNGNLEFLRSVARILKPAARFVLQTNCVAEIVFPHLQRQRWFELGGILCLHDTQYDPLTTELTSTYRMMRGTEREEKQAVYRIYLCREILSMFAEAGFSRTETFGSLKREPFGLRSDGLLVVATR